jgi:2-oxoacid:acceptor oxidoreductase delta subunit (pyruvate/2-ketoisovalerate family)
MGERVLVIGGGNVAIDVCRTLIRLGCSTAILYRRTREAMPAHDQEIDDAVAEGAEMQYLLSPSSIAEQKGGGLVLECTKMMIQGVDDAGRPKAVPVQGETVSYNADQIILSTGEFPDLSYLSKELQSANGFVVVNAWGQTSVDKVFAGGDMIDQPWTVSQAIGSGKRAAIAMDHFLRGNDINALIESGSIARTMRHHLGLEEFDASSAEGAAVTGQELNLAYCQSQEGMESVRLTPEDRAGNFDEVDHGLAPEAALQEAGRCLSCGVCKVCGNCYLYCPDSAVKKNPETGRYDIDYEYCKGCGICQNECPVGAIIMESEGEA